ncbi:MAG: hypothetical protein ABIP42_14170, partial [Planctomycetota bacterium]
MATFALFGVVVFASFFSLVPALDAVSDIHQGYFLGLDAPWVAYVTTMLVAVFLALFGMANWVFHWKLGLRSFGLAAAVQLLALIGGIAIVHWTYDRTIDRCVARAQETVDAIHAYERDKGCAPRTLKDLVPDYLPRDPSLLLEDGPGLYYCVSTGTLPPPVGEWWISPESF